MRRRETMLALSTQVTQIAEENDFGRRRNPRPPLKKPKGTIVEQENATLSDFKVAGVRLIRIAIAPTDDGVEFVKRICAQEIKFWVVSVQYRGSYRGCTGHQIDVVVTVARESEVTSGPIRDHRGRGKTRALCCG
jgi:hypothetical protein